MIRTAVLCLFILFLSAFSSYSQKAVRIDVSTDDKSIAVADLLIDRTWLRIKPDRIIGQATGGLFKFQFASDRNRMVELIIGQIRLPLYVQSGDSLLLQITGKSAPSISVSGSAAEENEFLQKFFSQFEVMFKDTFNQSKMLSSTVDVFESDLFNLKKAQEKFLKDSPKYASLRSDFRTFIENQILYHYWSSLLNYPITRANSSATILKVDPLPDVMMEGLQNVNINNEEALIADSYRNFLKYYNIYFTSKANRYQKFTDYSISADKKVAMAKDKYQGAMYTYWLAKFITEECGRLAPFMVRKMQTQLKEVDLTGLFSPVVKEYCDGLPSVKTVEQTGEIGKTKGANNKELDLVNAEGKSVELTDFKGKVVYIDFWASWCGPCRMMMPFSKKLHEQLSEKEKKQIIFLYISIDADKAAWMKGMKDMDIQGVNVISPGNWHSKACKYFQINGIPRYMIMNKKGEIVDFNAKRPADNAVLEDLRKLLND